MTRPGKKDRILITNICPVVDEGKYPSKAVVQQPVLFEADIFTEGHDELKAVLFIRHVSQKKWSKLPMTFMHNDHWQASFTPGKTGVYKFYMQAWIDRFETWKHALIKRKQAGQDLHIALEEGAELLQWMASSAEDQDRLLLLQAALECKEKEQEDAFATVTGESVEAAASGYTDRSSLVISGEYCLEAERTKAGFSTWYELFPRSASAEPNTHGTFRDVKKLIPRIAEMGFDVIYFPPVHPIGEQHRKGKNNSLTAQPGDPGSPWAIGNAKGGHKSIHPQLGSLKDFKDLLEEAAAYDIEIALDLAFQCSPDHPYVKEHPQWFKWRPDGTVQYAENPPKKYEDILPFYFETDDWKALWNELKSVVDYWIEQGVRIFRVDNPHTKPFAFWEWMIAKVRKQYPDVLFLSEAFTRPRIMEQLAKAGFNQSYTYFAWRNTKQELETYMKELTHTSLRHYFRPNFWPNTPDILTPYLSHGGETPHIIRLVLAATLSSNYGIYGPVYEFLTCTPAHGKEEYIDNEKYEIKTWNWQEHTRMKEIITRVNKIRREHAAFQYTCNIAFAETKNEQIICYTKYDEHTNERFIVAVNLDPFHTQSSEVKIPVAGMGLGTDQSYRVKDLLSGDSYIWNGEWNYVELSPYEMPAHIFQVEAL